MAYFVNSKQAAETCRLERNKADQTRNINKGEHFVHWTEWSQRTIADLKKQNNDKPTTSSGKCDR